MRSIHFTQDDLMARVARFTDLVGNVGGFPDSDLAGCRRTLYNVIGFRPPSRTHTDDGAEIMSPIGSKSSAHAPIAISEGFNLAFVGATRGNGTILHNHDTNETFVPLTGRWQFHCNDDEDLSIELGPMDTVSFPAGLPRRFANTTPGTDPDEEHLMLVIIAGDTPTAVMEPDVLVAGHATGRYTPAARPS